MFKNPSKIKIYGTLGPACHDTSLLKEMIAEGMSGVRLNLSHISLANSRQWLDEWQEASEGSCDLLVDMQGPEMRIGSLSEPVCFNRHDQISLPVPGNVMQFLGEGQEVLLDDGRYTARVISTDAERVRLLMHRDGELSGGKSIKIPGVKNTLPPLTDHDMSNISLAKDSGVTGVMQPFVRGKDDLIALRRALDDNGAEDIKIFAKIENREGVDKLDEILAFSDWVVIARGDLGNDIPLWELPVTQRYIAKKCRKANKPFIVVTQMLASMEHSPVPTRAEVSDIDHAVLDGAGGVMVTGETAVGSYPLEVIRYLSRTINASCMDLYP